MILVSSHQIVDLMTKFSHMMKIINLMDSSIQSKCQYSQIWYMVLIHTEIQNLRHLWSHMNMMIISIIFYTSMMKRISWNVIILQFRKWFIRIKHLSSNQFQIITTIQSIILKWTKTVTQLIYFSINTVIISQLILSTTNRIRSIALQH